MRNVLTGILHSSFVKNNIFYFKLSCVSSSFTSLVCNKPTWALISLMKVITGQTFSALRLFLA